jgi:hypothetical protein
LASIVPGQGVSSKPEPSPRCRPIWTTTVFPQLGIFSVCRHHTHRRQAEKKKIERIPWLMRGSAPAFTGFQHRPTDQASMRGARRALGQYIDPGTPQLPLETIHRLLEILDDKKVELALEHLDI